MLWVGTCVNIVLCCAVLCVCVCVCVIRVFFMHVSGAGLSFFSHVDAGLANGISQSLVALTRAVGPALGSVLLAWSLLSSLPFPLDYHFVFLISGGICLAPVALSFLLGPEFNRV